MGIIGLQMDKVHNLTQVLEVRWFNNQGGTTGEGAWAHGPTGPTLSILEEGAIIRRSPKNFGL